MADEQVKIAEVKPQWWKGFWDKHGERLVFMTLATCFAAALYAMDMKDEAKVVFIGVMMLCYNKARGNGNPQANNPERPLRKLDST